MDKKIILDWMNRILLVTNNALDNFTDEEIKAEFKELQEQLENFKEEQVRDIIACFETNCDPKNLIYIYSVMLVYMDISLFADSLVRTCIKSDYSGLAGAYFEVQICRLPDCDHRLLRQLREKNVRSLIQEYDLQYDYIPVQKRDQKKIVIFAEQMLADLHAPTQVILRYVYILKKLLGYDVKVVALPCHGKLPREIWYKSFSINYIEEYEAKVVKRTFKDVEFEIYQISMENKYLQKELRMIFDLVYAWAPLCIFSLGSINPVTDIANTFTTEIYQDMGTGIPVTQADIILQIMDLGTQKEGKIYLNDLPQRQIIYPMAPIREYFEKSNNPVSKGEINCADTDFTVCIVGNRLDDEIDEDFIEMLCKLVASNDHVKIIVVGIVQNTILRFYDHGLMRYSQFLGYCDDLFGLYNAIDLYINPVRHGGGFSAAIAFSAGTPVVTLPDCDVAYWAGEHFSVKDLDEMLSTIEKYICDDRFISQQMAYVQELQKEADESTYWRKWTERAKEIIDLVYDYPKDL